jgi:hypothetical protein
MFLLLRIFLVYYMLYMVYRLGRRAKLQRIYRIRLYKKELTLGTLGAACIGILVGIQSTPRAGMALPALLTSHIHTSSHRSKGSTNTSKHLSDTNHTSGSKPIPAGSAYTVAASSNSSTIRTAVCSGTTANPALTKSPSPELRKLAQYQQVCNALPVVRSSFFVPTPATTQQAQAYASDVVAQLKAYAQAGVSPLVFMEPDSATGTLLDLTQYSGGAYDSALDTYFSDIKAAGVTDAMMGMWVMLPEGNLPEWTSVDPATFAANVTKVAQFQKKYFPTSQTTIMLDSQTYPSATSWDGGAYVSLLPFVQNIPKGLIDSFGLQGFPWASPANQNDGNLYNPKVYLRTDLAAQAAQALGISNIWLNTGTFGRMYANTASETVVNSPAQRQTMLDGVVTEVKTLQHQGFSVSVHLFAQDKSADSEGTDWSYWQTPGDSQNTVVFTTFAHDLAAANVPLWLFDTY